MKFRKIMIATLGITLSLCLVVVSYGYADFSHFASAQVSTQKTVIIDAGHGGLTNTIN